jgi:FkbM family methyltransferase
VAGALRRSAHERLRALGFDVVRWPASTDLGVHLAEVLAATRVNCVLDVGGHVGVYGEFLRRIGYTGRIVSFEPVTRNFDLLEARSRGDVDWRVLQCGVGAVDAAAQINVSVHPGMESLLELTEAARSNHGLAVDLERLEEVALRRLDTGVLDEHLADLPEPRLLLKADTQGYDLEVVRGAAGVLDRVAAVQLELALLPAYVGAARLEEGLEELAGLGFVPTGVFSGYRDKRLRLHEVDCVFRRVPETAGATGAPE